VVWSGKIITYATPDRIKYNNNSKERAKTSKYYYAEDKLFTLYARNHFQTEDRRP